MANKLRILLLALCIALLPHHVCSYAIPRASLHKTRKIAGPLYSGYVPPERDAEYRKVVPKSLWKPLVNTSATDAGDDVFREVLPTPKEGDIVLCPPTWPGEVLLGRIRYMELNKLTNTMSVEVIPLKDGKSEGIYFVDKSAKSFSENLDNLKPIRTVFIRSENGYKVSFRKGNATDVILKAPSYVKIDDSFVLPTKTVNINVLQSDLKKYTELKERIVVNTLRFGAVGTVITTVWLGPDVSLPYFLGAMGGAAYLVLLGKKVDGIGAGFNFKTPLSVEYTDADDSLSKRRLLIPLFLVAILAGKNLYIDHRQVTTIFQLLDKTEFLATMAGFLTNRLAFLVSEVAAEIRTEDVLSIVPGSMAEAYRQNEKLKALKEGTGEAMAADTNPALKNIVFVTGPRAAGRSAVASDLINRKKTYNSMKLTPLRFLTTDNAAWTKDPARYRLVTIGELNGLRESGLLVYEGLEKGYFGQVTNVAISAVDLKGGEKEETLILDAQPDLLDQLAKLSYLRLINVWVSMQTKDQFIQKATSIVQVPLSISLAVILVTSQIDQEEVVRGLKADSDKAALAQKGGEEISQLVNEAASDITYYMRKAPLFEYALLNSGSQEEIVDELDQLLKNAL